MPSEFGSGDTGEPGEDCPDAALLAALGGGRLHPYESSRIEAHLTHCEVCCRRLEEMSDRVLHKLVSTDNPLPFFEKGENRATALDRAIRRLKSDPEALSPSSALPLNAEDELQTLLGNSPAEMGGASTPGSLGPYRIQEEVARGGMGIVLKAYDPDLQRSVAIKILAPSKASIPSSRDAFLREARAAARLQHENVMPIYAVDQHGALPYLVMPFVDGPNLEEHLREHAPLHLDELVKIGHQTCRALEEAHENGLVHRDIKPANIMLVSGDRDGDRLVWLADFGLAHAAEAPADHGAGSTTSIAGTPGYMAPEQVLGAAIDQRADLFALGCVLHAMAGDGRSPFRGDSLAETMERVQNEEPPPLGLTPGAAPEWLEQLVSRLLAKDPNKRPQRVAEVREIFEAHLPGSRPGSRRRTILVGAVVAAITAAIVIPVSISLFGNAPKSAPPPPPEGFFLSASADRIFGTLQEALETAGPGDTVIVRKNGEIEIDSIFLPPDLPITIRAASGYQPVFVSKSFRTTNLQTESALCLEGLEFRHPFAEDPGDAVPILLCRSAPVLLANCRFVRSTSKERPSGFRYRAPPLVDFRDCLQVELRNCEFLTNAATILACKITTDRSESTLQAANNLFVGQFGLRLDSGPSNKNRWQLEQNTFAGSIPILVSCRGREFAHVDIRYEYNLFDFKNCLLELRKARGRKGIGEVLARTTIGGRANLYRRTLHRDDRQPNFVVLTSESDPTLTAPKEFANFSGFSKAFGNSGKELGHPVFDWNYIEAYRSQFPLMKPELFKPSASLAAQGDTAGFVREFLGPGDGYDRWRSTPGYKTWRETVDQAMP